MSSTLRHKILAGLGLGPLVLFLLVSIWPYEDEARTEPSRSNAHATGANQAALKRVQERTLRESQFGIDPVKIQAPLAPPPEASRSAIDLPERGPSLPEGYTIAEHLGSMQRAPLTVSAQIKATPNPEWLDPAIGIGSILAQPLSPDREEIFAALRLAPGADVGQVGVSLSRLGATVEGASGDYLRILVPPRQTQIQAIAELPNVLGLGAFPPELKLDTHFAANIRSMSASHSTPVFITLMGDDSHGGLKQALTTLGVTVGDYDPSLRSYTANLPTSALDDVASADYVLRIDPIAVVSATHDSAVPVMGVDGLRTYSFANRSFAGLTGKGIAVGVLDTGLNTRHMDIGLGRGSVCGTNFVVGEDWDLMTDVGQHGTHVFGTIAGSGRADPLYAGMAPNLSHLRFGKVLAAQGAGSEDDIRRGMDFLARKSSCRQSEAAVKPMIVNMSLGKGTVTSSGRGIGERKLDSIVYSHEQA